MVISTVRSNPRGAVGFLSDARRMNVVVTRARFHVAVVCDSQTVGRHAFLGRLLRHVKERGEWVSVEDVGFKLEGAVEPTTHAPEHNAVEAQWSEAEDVSAEVVERVL